MLPTDRRTDGPTDGPTDRRTDRVTYKVMCTRLFKSLLVRRSVHQSIGHTHYSASSFCIAAPAKSYVTDALVYAAPPRPRPHITAPAQPHTTDAVVYTALIKICAEKLLNYPAK